MPRGRSAACKEGGGCPTSSALALLRRVHQGKEKLATARAELRRLLVQFAVLASIDIRRDINDLADALKAKQGGMWSDFGGGGGAAADETSNPLTAVAAEPGTANPRLAVTDHARRWQTIAKGHALFRGSEVIGS